MGSLESTTARWLLRARASFGVNSDRLALAVACLLYAMAIVSWVLTWRDQPWRYVYVTLTLVLAFLIGSAMGSLSNVFIFRLPRGMALTNPRHSICATCRSRLTILDMFPVISYLVLRGRCRHCGQQIPSRYLKVELLQGIGWTCVWYWFLVVNWDPTNAALCTVLGSLALISLYIRREVRSMPKTMIVKKSKASITIV